MNDLRKLYIWSVSLSLWSVGTATTACTKSSVIFSSLVSVISCGGEHMGSDSLLICKNSNSDDIR